MSFNDFIKSINVSDLLKDTSEIKNTKSELEASEEMLIHISIQLLKKYHQWLESTGQISNH